MLQSKTAKKPRGKPFAPGNNANPRGRPRKTEAEKQATRDALEIMRAAAPEAARMLTEMAISPDTRADLRVKCAEIVMDRVYGRASQPIEGNTKAEIKIVIEGGEDYGA